MKIQARVLLGFTQAQLWDILTGQFTLVFDDGLELETNAKETLYSSYVWEAHRRTGAPLYKDHHVSAVLDGQRLSSSTHLKLLSKVLWSVYDDTASTLVDEDARLKFRYELAELAYRITNTMYNDLSARLEQYVGSLDITDFHEVLNHPKIVEAYDQLVPTRQSIEHTYKVITDTLQDKSTMGHNPLSKLARSGLVNDKQVQQCLGPRGFITDIDSIQFKEPVLRGYSEGIRQFYDSAIESRSAAKSLVFSKAPLQDTEYFSRRLQLISMVMENLHHGDCGSTKYLRWTVRGRETRDGELHYSGDLRQLVGKHYLDETTNTLKTIKASDQHLVGKTIQMRSVLHCAHPDPQGVCSTCFGQLSDSIPVHSNLGHMCSTFVTQQSSQAVLSVKHLDGSAVVEVIILSDGDKHYMKVASDGNSYLLADPLKTKKISLVIPPGKSTEKPVNITDVNEVSDVSRLIISRVSELSQIGVVVNDGKSISEGTVDVSVDRRYSSMTHELLQHIKDNGWTTDDNGNYVIDMAGWNWSKPILSLPLKHFNMSDHSKDIAKMLEGTVGEMMERSRYVHPDAMLGELFTLVNRRLSVNLAPLEVTLYAAMIVSAENYDYSLPKPWTRSGVGVVKKTMANRSLAASMAFQEHTTVILSPESYALTNRVEHVLDTILMPREVTTLGNRER